MTTLNSIFLVDSDVRRRALIARRLADLNFHVEPFEGVNELMARWPRQGLLLVHDDGCAIAGILAHMTQCGQWLPVTGFAESPTTRMVVQAVIEGAIDYISWPCEGKEIAKVFEEVMNKAEGLKATMQRRAIARSHVDRLTRREQEVLTSIADGLSNRRIGEKLAISPRTVEIHRANMLKKMRLRHTSEAIRIAIEAAAARPSG